jgi:hypothetical protein
MKPSSCSAAGITDSSNSRTDSATSSVLTCTLVTRHDRDLLLLAEWSDRTPLPRC